jgi:hypothetical protein
MKHIKIFEDFSGVGGPGGRPGGARLMPGMRGTVPEPNFGGATKYLIGYFATGGYGSHPSVVTADELESNGWSESRPGSGSWSDEKNGLMFQVMNESTRVVLTLHIFSLNFNSLLIFLKL